MSMAPNNAPPQWTETMYRSSRTKTIVAILLAVLALAGAGLLAGTVVDAPNTPLPDAPIDTEGGGPPLPEMQPAAFVQPQVEASPSAIPSAPASPSPVASAPATTLPAASPSPVASPPPATDPGGGIVLGGGIVTIPVIPPWQGAAGDTGTFANLSSGQGDWIYTQVSPPGSSTAPASGILAQALPNFLPPETYTQLQQGTVTEQPGWGAITTLAYVPYKATYVDTQGSAPLMGVMWVAVRQDGAVMITTAESIPAERFPQTVWKPIVDGAYNSFASPGA